MANENSSAAGRRAAASRSAQSSRRHKRDQEEHQASAEDARKRATEARERQVKHEEQNQAAARFVKEAAEVDAATIRFLNTEADTALNFARIAANSDDTKKRDRNRRNARLAYDTALKHLGAAPLTSDEREAVQRKIATLRELLKSLGERI